MEDIDEDLRGNLNRLLIDNTQETHRQTDRRRYIHRMIDHYNENGNLDAFNEDMPNSPGLRRHMLRREGLTKYQINRLSRSSLSYDECTFLKLESCSICLDQFEEDQEVRRMPKCNHIFHM
jgi:hypothetical protein